MHSITRMVVSMDNNTPDNNDRRSFSRISFDSQTRITQNDKSWAVELIDISLKGLLVAQPEDWSDADTEQAFEVIIQLDGDYHIAMQVEWRHSEDQHMGFQCTTIDIDSIVHLRRIVELNLSDTALLERELAALGNQ